jgi:protein TonB
VLGPIVLTLLTFAATSSTTIEAQSKAAQPPAVSPSQTELDLPWPPEGVVREGAGVKSPRLISGSGPSYAPMALKHKISGLITLEAVVEVDGTVGEVRVVRSLDRKYGLDDAAVESLKRWKFAPGTKDDVAVPVLIEVDMSFSLHDTGRKRRR